MTLNLYIQAENNLPKSAQKYTIILFYESLETIYKIEKEKKDTVMGSAWISYLVCTMSSG